LTVQFCPYCFLKQIGRGELSLFHGAITPEELAEAETWANEALARSKRTGARQRQSA